MSAYRNRGDVPTVTVLTAITDGYDTLKRHPDQFGVDTAWIAVTDGTEQAEADHGWEIRDIRTYATPVPDDLRHPNRLAKLPKCCPWLYTSSPYVIWIDASYRVVSPVFASDVIKFANPIAQFVHPWRDCVFDEAVESLKLEKYRDDHDRLAGQYSEYREIGHPNHWGLWATGVIIRKYSEDVRIMGRQWIGEIRRWSYQDQVSEAVSLRLCDLRPNPLPGDHINNRWLKYEGSARHG